MTAFKKRKIDDQCNASRRVASRSTTRRARALERRGRGRDERLDERRRTSSRTRVSRDGVWRRATRRVVVWTAWRGSR